MNARFGTPACHAWLGAAALLVTPLLFAAQQQPSNPRGNWPCGARIDPSYFQIAEGSGGHLLLLSPDEIGDSAALLTAFSDHPHTIVRLAGSIPPGLHEFQIPIDSSVESVLFSVSMQCLQVADVLHPSGEPVIASDDVTAFSSFRGQRMVVVRRPEPGLWSVRVSGSGVTAVVAQARSAVTLAQVEFAPLPAGTFTAIPSPHVDNAMRIRVGGRVTDVRASLVSGVLRRLGDLPLEPGETGSYTSRFTPPAESFRVLVVGKDERGFAFQRMHAPLYTTAR